MDENQYQLITLRRTGIEREYGDLDAIRGRYIRAEAEVSEYHSLGAPSGNHIVAVFLYSTNSVLRDPDLIEGYTIRGAI